MKYYETTFEEYLHASKENNLHPELDPLLSQFPKTIDQFQNLILYGPSGSGKYTQALKIIEKYSPSKLKYDRKISVSNDKMDKKKQILVETVSKKKTGDGTTKSAASAVTAVSKKEINISKKQEFTYRISDIHYEIDMTLLGCNSKTIWHDIFFQIVDIVSVKPQKTGIILCKNFEATYNELLDIFYSYMKHPLEHMKIQIYFILLTESVSFIPNNILNSSCVIPVRRPSKEQYISMIESQRKHFFFSCQEDGYGTNNMLACMNEIDESTVVNSKELFMLKKLKRLEDLPTDIEMTICDKILKNMEHPNKINLVEFRNVIYELLVYNVNIPECMYYIMSESIQKYHLDEPSISDMLKYSYTFLKYFNNNYRSIYHLESMIFFIMNKMHFNTNIVI